MLFDMDSNSVYTYIDHYFQAQAFISDQEFLGNACYTKVRSLSDGLILRLDESSI